MTNLTEMHAVKAEMTEHKNERYYTC